MEFGEQRGPIGTCARESSYTEFPQLYLVGRQTIEIFIEKPLFSVGDGDILDGALSRESIF